MSLVTAFEPEGRPGLLEEANHRIANHLAIAVGMVNAQISALRKGPQIVARDVAEQMLRDTQNRILGIARLHRRLMREPRPGVVELSDFLIETIQHFATALALGDKLSVRHKLSS